MTVTTPGAIRDVLIALVVAVVPDLATADRFRAHREDATVDELRAWCEKNPAAVLRLFSITFRHDVTVPDVCDGNQERVRQTFDMVIAYPLRSNRYGNAREMNDVIAADLRKLRGTIGYAGFPLTYAPHASLCTVLSESSDLVERGTGTTFASLELTIEYWRTLL